MPVIVKVKLPNVITSTNEISYKQGVNWKAANDEHLAMYKETAEKVLRSIKLPIESIYCNNPDCKLSSHRSDINQFCQDIISKLVDSADDTLPKHVNKKRHKPMWKQLVEPEKDKALFWHSIWCSAGRPTTGVLADIRRHTRSLYHKAIRDLSKQEHNLRLQRMATSVYESESRSLWSVVKKLRSNNSTSEASIDGSTASIDIADIFKCKYENLFNSNVSSDKEMDQIENDIMYKIKNGNCESHVISVQQVINGVNGLNKHKSDGDAGLFSNNLIFGPNRLYVYLSLLYSTVMIHGYMPDSLLLSTIVPIPKNTRGNLSSSDNYRGISLCSSITKLFELIIVDMHQCAFETSNLQFAFKGKHSTTMCTSVFKEVVSYYVKRDTDVYCCFLDATKAFDLIRFDKLFQILCSKPLPGLCLRVLLDMYKRQKIQIKWNDTFSNKFSTSNGIRQGGIISPLLFNVYIDVLLTRLKNRNVGCFIGNMYVGCLGYADDVTLLAPSVSSLQNMLEVCNLYGKDYGLQYNCQKTVCMKMSQKNCNLVNYKVSLDGTQLKWVQSVSFLGIFVSYNMDDTNEFIHKRGSFYSSVNSLLGNFRGVPRNILNVLFSHYCVSFYGSQSWDLRNKNINCVYRAYNKCLRVLWGLPYDSHTNIVLYMAGSNHLSVIVAGRFVKMLLSMYQSDNILLKFLFDRCMSDVASFMGSNLSYLKKKYDVQMCVPLDICNFIYSFLKTYQNVSTEECVAALTAKELISYIDGECKLDNISMDHNELKEVINQLTTN